MDIPPGLGALILVIGGIIFLLLLGRGLLSWAFMTTDIHDRLKATEKNTAEIAKLLREQAEREKKHAPSEEREPAIR